jgi:hypothetical protein
MDQGAHADAVVWDDPNVPWADYDAVVIRSCWDYHLRPDAFRVWIARLEALGVPLWNPGPLVRWNMDKGYLRDLAARGVRIVPTYWGDRGTRASLVSILDEHGWSEAVVKPRISASAHETWRTTRDRAADDQPRFDAVAAASGVLVQPFLEEVATAGEWSLCFFSGVFSHAVLKRPSEGEFRVQSHLGGTHAVAVPDAALVADAERVVSTIAGPWLYARVDGCVVGGAFHLMELELIEPLLFLADHAEAPHRFARAMRALAHSRAPAALFLQHHRSGGRPGGNASG